MNFCEKCQNMLYIKIASEDSDNLIHYCRNCGHTEEMQTNNLCVSKTSLKRSNLKYENSINKYTKLDPTLPRINTIKCPNEHCESNTDSYDKKHEIIYIRYDDTQMKYVYLCPSCDTVWKTDEQK